MSSDLEDLFKPIVLITGFGPFENHPVNASWEAVKLMDKEEMERRHNIELVLIEMPVTYHNVDEFVPALWETHEPKLMIHVGVSSVAKQLTLETQAHRKGYKRMDYFERCPADHICPAEGAVRIRTKLDVDRLCEEFNKECSAESSAVASYDAGRYLCEYIYYTSLSVDSTRTLFVHVPDLKLYPSAQTATGLERILDLCLQQIREIDQTTAVAEMCRKVRLSDSENGDSDNGLSKELIDDKRAI